MKKQMKNEKAITLVALLVTIIILLIVSGITISTLTQTELFEKAQKTKQEVKEKQKEENTILGDYENSINEIVSTGSRENASMYPFILKDNLIKKLELNEEYVLEENAYFIGCINTKQYSGYGLTIDDESIAWIGQNTGTNIGISFPSVFVKKGSKIQIKDVYNTGAYGIELYLYAIKWK